MINEIKEKILDEIRYGELNNDNGLLPTWLNKPEILHHAEYMKCFQDGVTCKQYTDAVIVKNIFKEFEKADVPDTNVGEWIPVSERLPEDENIMYWTTHEDESVVMHGFTKKNGFVFNWEVDDLEKRKRQGDVIAWMPLPLPEPYEEANYK